MNKPVIPLPQKRIFNHILGYGRFGDSPLVLVSKYVPRCILPTLVHPDAQHDSWLASILFSFYISIPDFSHWCFRMVGLQAFGVAGLPFFGTF